MITHTIFRIEITASLIVAVSVLINSVLNLISTKLYRSSMYTMIFIIAPFINHKFEEPIAPNYTYFSVFIYNLTQYFSDAMNSKTNKCISLHTMYVLSQRGTQYAEEHRLIYQALFYNLIFGQPLINHSIIYYYTFKTYLYLLCLHANIEIVI